MHVYSIVLGRYSYMPNTKNPPTVKLAVHLHVALPSSQFEMGTRHGALCGQCCETC